LSHRPFAWDATKLAFGLKDRKVQVRVFSKTHIRIWLPHKWVVDAWPTTGRWYSHGYGRHIGTLEKFFQWFDEKCREQIIEHGPLPEVHV